MSERSRRSLLRTMLPVLIVLATAVATPAVPAETAQTAQAAEAGKGRSSGTGPRRTEAPGAARASEESQLQTDGRRQAEARPDPEGQSSADARSEPLGQAAPQTVTSNFTGATLADTVALPPDSMGAAGPTQFLVGVNGRIRSFNKETRALDPPSLDLPMDTFFGSVRTPGFSIADPRVRFDRLSGRWFVVAIDKALNSNRIVIAVSSGPILVSPQSFSFFYFQQDLAAPAGDTGDFADYPSLGVDVNALYIGVNEFDGKSGPFVNSTAFVVPKAAVLGVSATPTNLASSGGAVAFRNLIDPPGAGESLGTGPVAPQGVDNLYDPTATTGYFIGVDNATFGTLVMRRVTFPGGRPTISPENILIDLPASTSSPVDVPHPGNTVDPATFLDGTDDRLLSATLRNGRLWTSQSIAVTSQGTASNSDPNRRNGSRWYELQGLDTTPSVAQLGTLFDPTVTPTPRHYWIPTVMVSGQGHMALGASTGGATYATDAVATGRLAGDPSGTLQEPVLYTAAISPDDANYSPETADQMNQLNGNGRRWGDYSYTSLDPNDDMTMWTVQEFVNGNDSYGVQVARLTAPPPATPVAASPSAVAPAQTSVNVTVTGSSAGGAGFYDPGSDFPSRLTTSVSGGVTVNSVTYVNPTTIILNLNTTSATLGTKTVTVTNPDGQSRAGTVLNVTSTSPPTTSAPTTSPPTTSAPTTSPPTTAPPLTPASAAEGYRLVARDGGIFAFGDAGFFGSTGALRLNRPIVGMAATPSGNGYWLVASDGGIFAFGDARFFGSTGAITLNRPIVGMAATPSGNGYWLVASDGGIFALGDARFFGSTGAITLNRPIVGMASTPSGNGYWLVASDGGIFAFGDAVFRGSTGAIRLAQPIVGMASTPSGNGYWLVASDGGIFAFGDARFFGSTGAIRLAQPIVGMASTPSGNGYWLVASDGGIFAFGGAGFFGSTGAMRLAQPIAGMSL